MKALEEIVEDLTKDLSEVINRHLEDCVIIRPDQWELAYIDAGPEDGFIFGVEDIDGKIHHLKLSLTDFFSQAYDFAEYGEDRLAFLEEMRTALDTEISELKAALS
jgi:hypothetical protein